MILKRNIFAYLSASLIERVLGLLGTSFAMRLNSAEMFGIFSHLRTLPVSVVPFASLGLENAVARVHSRQEKAPFLVAIFLVWIAAAAVVAGFSVPIARFYMGEAFFREAAVPAYALRMLVFSNILLALSISSCVVMERAQLASALTSAIAVLGFSGLAVFGLTHSITSAIRLFAIGTTCLLAGLFLLRLQAILAAATELSGRLRSEPSAFWGRFLSDLRFCLPFALSSWVAIIANRAGAMIFSNLKDGSGLALANLALNIAGLTQVFGWALNNSENPKVLNRLLAAGEVTPGRLDEAFAKLTGASHLAVIGCCLSLVVAVLYALFSTTRWTVSIPLFGYIALFAVAKFLFDVVGTFLQYDFLYLKGKLGSATLVKTLLQFMQIPALGYLAGRYSVPGALAGYLLTSVLNFLPGEIFLGREFLRRRLSVYGRHALACSPFLLLFLARTRPTLIAFTAAASLLAATADIVLAPVELKARLLKWTRLRLH